MLGVLTGFSVASSISAYSLDLKKPKSYIGSRIIFIYRMALLYPEIVFTLSISILGSIFGVVGLALYSELRRNPKTIMAKFKLHPDKTEKDFTLMLYANAALSLFMGTMAVSSFLDFQTIFNLSYVGQTLAALVIVDTIGSWVWKYT